MTIPGIGYITAVTILQIVDHGRFANAEKLVSYDLDDDGVADNVEPA